MQSQSETITLLTVDDLPVTEERLSEIAEASVQAAFKVIADELSEDTACRVSGDFMPDEVFALDRVFRLFVRAMAVNVQDGKEH